MKVDVVVVLLQRSNQEQLWNEGLVSPEHDGDDAVASMTVGKVCDFGSVEEGRWSQFGSSFREQEPSLKRIRHLVLRTELRAKGSGPVAVIVYDDKIRFLQSQTP
jgi:hypothetical protein